MLLVASDEDAYAMRSARELQKGAARTRELVVLTSAGHGTIMLTRSPDLGFTLQANRDVGDLRTETAVA